MSILNTSEPIIAPISSTLEILGFHRLPPNIYVLHTLTLRKQKHIRIVVLQNLDGNWEYYVTYENNLNPTKNYPWISFEEFLNRLWISFGIQFPEYEYTK